MENRFNLSLLIGALLAGANCAHAAQPPDPVGSDSLYNTAAGEFALLDETTGTLNTGIGYQALYSIQSGSNNTALGASALWGNTTGVGNTASGNYALHLNQNGTDNTASGLRAMYHNVSGGSNTATGAYALENNYNGGANTVQGYAAMYENYSGNSNTAIGTQSMWTNYSGSANSALGMNTLYFVYDGINNTAVGTNAMYDTVHGGNSVAVGYEALMHGDSELNVAIGTQAMFNNGGGGSNVAVGGSALSSNVTGNNNVAIGANAGIFINTSNNVDIGNVGVASDSAVIRIGTQGTQTSTFLAGVTNSKVTGAAVYITASGQLGVLASSERYKTSIASMGTRTESLQKLRPVTFHLKNDPKGHVQYGLIAEEVVKVYPELVIRDEKGVIQGVRYDELAPMLLNELQQQHAELRAIKAALKQSNDRLEAALSRLEGNAVRVAMR